MQMEVWSFHVCGHLFFFYYLAFQVKFCSLFHFYAQKFHIKEHGTMRQAVQKHIGEIRNRYREKFFFH